MGNSVRFNALSSMASRPKPVLELPEERVSSFFGSHVFGDEAMKAYLPARIYKQFKSQMALGQSLDRVLADHIADAMRVWALAKGVTHYAHWFQPLTGRTAEKHDSFFTLDRQGKAIEEFSGESLVQQEPDGSSFPGGGLRTTFEARGYTAWDPTSPAFILEVEHAKTLCIPTIFVTYGGQSLDYKLPLLKSQKFLEQAALDVCRLFEQGVNKVYATLGWEQEYFLVDEALYNARPDLVLTGRTLLGRYAPKGQQLEDHYFGAIPERVYSFMRDLEVESHKLGIPVRTRHNEVAPNQYELAPIFEEVNVAVDHNQLLMDLMDRIAHRHKLRVLLHEKPFAGVNGSGKHNNWSMATDTGKNLLSPGKTPGKNLEFLSFFVTTIQSVYKHADLLRASVATAGNDHRLGANEAPPAIISVFIGEGMSKVLNEIEKGVEPSDAGVKEVLNLLSTIPNLELDNTDRNRTSPFAFTGNKFEIRMVGSSQNCAGPMTVMNTIMAQQLREFYQDVQILMASGMAKDAAILMVIKRYIIESKPIRFEGDNYSSEWKEEARRRGLNNNPTTPEALDALASEEVRRLFRESGVLSEVELHAHHEVRLETYALQMQIESRTMAELCLNQILPAAFRAQSEIAHNTLALMDIGLDEAQVQAQKELLEQMGKAIQGIKRQCDAMKALREQAAEMPTRKRADLYCHKVKPLMDEVRGHAAVLEALVEDKEWPLVKYREMFFIR